MNARARRGLITAGAGILGVALALVWLSETRVRSPSILDEDMPAPPRASADAPAPYAANEAVPDDESGEAADEELPDRPAPLGSYDEPTLDAALDAVEVQLRACREASLQQRQAAPAHVVVALDLAAQEGSSGAVTRAQLVESDESSPVFEACVNANVVGLRLPMPRGGGVLSLEAPFALTAADDEGGGPSAAGMQEGGL